MGLPMRLFSVIFLVLMLHMATDIGPMVAEARTCESQSHRFKGPCGLYVQIQYLHAIEISQPRFIEQLYLLQPKGSKRMKAKAVFEYRQRSNQSVKDEQLPAASWVFTRNITDLLYYIN
ncbi:hypothetical protein RJ639_013191 [Escallonia herrerae]|uniref:Uncharacterized protein n=1 Tax=Escallonia herrerae TaxID=1293975 RepID=A0AA88VJQ7_9ASTE|nr:hypothetical protein RJ639_013191 [Escallonia herrerae]